MKTQLIIHPNELSRRWIDYAVNLGVDVVGIHPVGGEKACESLAAMLRWLENDDAVNLIDYACSAGVGIEYELHAGSYLLPRELFSSHPEYFRCLDGRRTPDLNFCVSSDEASEIVAARACELAKKLYRSTDNYYFWLDDAKESSCECEECRALSASDQNLKVMNAIVRALRRKNPDAKLAYLAYYRTTPVPRSVRPEKGIFLEYAPFERDRKHYLNEEQTKAELDPLLEFFGKKDSKILEYWYDNSMFSGWKTPPKKFTPDGDTIRKEIGFYERAGAEYISSFACYFGKEYVDLYGEPDLTDFKK